MPIRFAVGTLNNTTFALIEMAIVFFFFLISEMKSYKRMFKKFKKLFFFIGRLRLKVTFSGQLRSKQLYNNWFSPIALNLHPICTTHDGVLL